MPSVLVTGASRGIGKSIVEHLASRGWDVIAGVRSQRDRVLRAASGQP
jgi:NAD(P)-dependent dehydrogenase (short-subunit alcohol dehydrogenase family)